MSLLEQVNQKLESKPLLYVCMEVERALGLENLLQSYHIICYEDSPIIDQLLMNGIKVYSVERAGQDKLIRKSTASILGSKWFHKIVDAVTEGKEFYLQTFHPTKPFFYQAQQFNCEILNNDPTAFEDLSDKLALGDLMNPIGVKMPKYLVGKIEDQNWVDLTKQLDSNKVVIQNRKSHTGEGTFIFGNESEFQEFKINNPGSEFKYSQFITGEAWTINGCIDANTVQVAGLSYQITGVPELTAHSGSTVGNDWSYAKELNEVLCNQIVAMTQQIGEYLQTRNYRGIFGIDVMVDPNNVYLIEINARQTANIPMQSYLEQLGNQTPLSLNHLAAFMQLPVESQNFKLIQGSQVFNRAKGDFSITHEVSIGAYRLQSDNSARDWENGGSKDDVVYLDEEQDKPIIFQEPSYNVTQIKGQGFQLLVGQIGQYKDNQEISRLQFTEGIISNSQLRPWVVEALVAIEKHIQ